MQRSEAPTENLAFNDVESPFESWPNLAISFSNRSKEARGHGCIFLNFAL